MSCLLQLPSISFHYSQSAPTSSAGLVMDMQNSTSHESPGSPRMEQFANASVRDQHNNMPVHTESSTTISFHHHPEVYLSCDTSGHIKDAGGFDPVMKHEAYFPQQNSPVEYFHGEHSNHNGFTHVPRPRFNVTEDPSLYAAPEPPPPRPQPCHIAARTNDAFSLNLKLELENYVHACETGTGEQFRKFRTPASPASSLSCSTSSLLSLAPVSGAGCPSRRHSFSATLQTAEGQGLCPSIHNPPPGSSASNSAYYRQRSHTYSSSPSKPHPYPLTKRQAGWQAAISAHNDLHDRIGDLQIRHDDDSNHPAMDEDTDGNEGSGEPSTREASRKGSMDDSKSTDPLNFLFLGPFGKKRKMVHERKQSLEGADRDLLHHTAMDDQSSQDANVMSPVGSDLSVHKEKVEDIVEEDEFDDTTGIEISYEESNDNEPLNLCIGEETETAERVGRLNLNCPGSTYSSQSSLCSAMKSGSMSGNLLSPPDGSVLRRQLLGLTETIGPTPPQYQTRDRSASMSVIILRDRMSVIQETRAALNPRRTLSPPPTNRTNGFQGPSHATSNVSINSLTSETSTSTKRILECQDCGKVFSQLRNYRYHRSRHEGTSQFACTCPVCHKQFNDRGYLSSHLKIHKNAKEYQCEFCEKSFNQRVAYNMHVRIHTGVKPHQCLKCDKAFSRRMLLKQHERTHTGERPYKCDVCGKAFADRSNMLLHQRLHTGLRPFLCHICQKSFSKNHHLKTHLNHHAGIKPYQCPKCHATFSQSSNMKTHFRKCTAVPVDENAGFNGPEPQDQKNAAAKTGAGTKCPTVAVHPTNSYNLHFEERPKQMTQSETYRVFSESEDRIRSNTFSHDRRGMNYGYPAYQLSQHLRAVSPPDGGHASPFQLSSSAPSSASIHAYMQNHHAVSPAELYASGGDCLKIQGVSPHSHPGNVEPEGRRNSFLQFALVESPGRNGSPSQHIPMKVSPIPGQRLSPLELQSSQLEHSPQHHLQQSLQHLQLSPHNHVQSPLAHQEEFRGRASTWSTNPTGRPNGFGKRKLPL